MRSIHRMALRKTLGLGDKIPANRPTSTHENVPCYDYYPEHAGNLLGYFTVIVKQAPAQEYRSSGHRVKSSQHRIFVVCPLCGREIPAGRTGQHMPACAKTHEGKACEWAAKCADLHAAAPA